VGGKWKPIIISHLKNSPKRFGKLDVLIPTISRKVLASQLSELVEHKMLDRISFPETPPRVEYQLTKKGKELVPIFESLAKWGSELVNKNKDED
tara:strand:- start:39 stop:320 length:282 start_codon:yes stop_codon:yes gene_type:complete